jgi:hypothetical protein
MSDQTLVDGALFPALPPLAPTQQRADDALAAVRDGRDWLAQVMAEQRQMAETPQLPFGCILASGGLPPQ